jgi:hypothetical protein
MQQQHPQCDQLGLSLSQLLYCRTQQHLTAERHLRCQLALCRPFRRPRVQVGKPVSPAVAVLSPGSALLKPPRAAAGFAV